MIIRLTLNMMFHFFHQCTNSPIHFILLTIVSSSNLLSSFFESPSLQALLSWLLQKKSEGFWIVGLEQTSSSVPLHQIEIPDYVASNNKTVLLLGKEKEGIPVQFLQAVDKCVEIPQFGMIRSLNVHVSGAITIWELTRKTRLAALEEQRKQDQT